MTALPTNEVRTQALGYRLIVAYKFVKGVIELALSVSLLVVARTRGVDDLKGLALGWQADTVHSWSMHVADLLVAAAQRRTLQWLSLAAALDAFVTICEGWALRAGRVWGEWLVVIATGSFLPLEAYEIVVHRRFLRIVVFAVNVAIVVYLAKRVRRRGG